MEDEKRMELFVEINDSLNYAMQQNGTKIIQKIRLKNLTDIPMEHVRIKIVSDIELIADYNQEIEIIQSNESVELTDIELITKADILANLTERMICTLEIEAIVNKQIIIKKSCQIKVLAYDEWPGFEYFPDMLAAFITPNHPVVASLMQSSSKWLNKWTGSPALDGYQSGNPDRVKKMAASVYAAMQELNITYSNPPASFEKGQRIRLCETIVEQHLGTCMDLTLMYAAVLEAMGLNSILVLMNGHIFAGVWLVEDSFSDAIVSDPSQIEKRMANGINEMIVVECTALCSGRSVDFEEAILLAKENVANYNEFQFIIDVLRARKSGVHPLPLRIKTENGYIVEHENRKEKDVTNQPNILEETIDINDSRAKGKATKHAQWEKKLLDLSMRNMLLNFRVTKAVVPLLTADVGAIEDALADGEEFRVMPRPMEWELANIDVFTAETTNYLGPYKDLIALECKRRRIPTVYSEAELNKSLVKMYRSAKTSMEENGASTLYLALGLLRWFEDDKSNMPRYAPIVLIPIEIIRKSANKGYTMSMRDDDAKINITLLELLKRNYDIEIRGLNPLPIDEHGLDIKKIFAIFRHGVMDKKMWDVIESAFIGNFSFSQFVMWNDIHNNKDILEKNKVVRSLMKGVIDWNCALPDKIENDEAYLPVTADSSQLRAINMAANGVSFVLHGPPGTGKSQTITAMIANALTKGKRILFVAEKMAALEVVQKRLNGLGIGDFCLELHSNKSTKKAVLDQLKRGLELGVWGTKTEYENRISSIHEMRSVLDSYAKAIHKRHSFGNNLRELIDAYEAVSFDKEILTFSNDYIVNLTEIELEKHKNLLERMVTAGKEVGHPCDNKMLPVVQEEYSQDIKFNLNKPLKDYEEKLIQQKEKNSLLAEKLQVSIPSTQKEIMQFYVDIRKVKKIEEIPEFLRDIDLIEEQFKEPIKFLYEQKIFEQKKKDFLGAWEECFLKKDISELREKYYLATKKFFGKTKAITQVASEIQQYAHFQIEPLRIPDLLDEIQVYQKELLKINEMQATISPQWIELLSKYSTIELINEYKNHISQLLNETLMWKNKINELSQKGNYGEICSQIKDVEKSFEELKEREEKVLDMLKLSFNEDANYFEKRIDLCRYLMENSSSIKSWIVYRKYSAQARKIGLESVCNSYESGMNHEDIIDQYLKSIYQILILQLIKEEPILNDFNGAGFNERIAQYKKLDQEFIDLTKDEIYYKLTHQLPTAYDSVEMNQELNILRKAITSNGRGVSIRTLFDQIPNVLKHLTPCMLMSPISVAQYLSMDNEPFDIVIFDEASQLPTCKAVGVLARGENAVIVGDPNQMPPTSFFAGNTLDEDNLDIEDLDSILDDCLALGMTQTHLQWHYRSRHESLIAFSNHEFYENQMLTFPAVNEREKKVSLVKVDGFFERGRGRVNRAEAENIVQEIKRRYNDSSKEKESIGVVTFNISQQGLIEDMLQDEFQKDSQFDAWANERDENLFIKNLENVQGDERDVILFSIAFGPDEEGKPSMNFGPLNREGGWKRLNVAVSRARNEMVVFSIMNADMIDLRRTKSKGVEALKDFLAFAEKGFMQNESDFSREMNLQGIKKRICQELKSAGYEYQNAVGHSEFKIDIAVLNPYNKEEYLLGILFDGASYYDVVNTKDREISQINILSGLGWDVIRVWTMDWWDNREKEIDKLLKTLNEKKQIAYEKHLTDSIKKDIEEHVESKTEEIQNLGELEDQISVSANCNRNIENEETPEDEGIPLKIANTISDKNEFGSQHMRNYDISEYKEADIKVIPLQVAELNLKENRELIVERINQIIDVEAPIALNCVVKKLLRSFNILRSSKQSTEIVEKCLKKANVKSIRQNGNKFYWKKEANPREYKLCRTETAISDKRNPKDICNEEIKNAVCIAILEKGALSKENLIRETIRTMGFSRSGTALVEAAKRGINYGKKTEEIVINEQGKFDISCVFNAE